MINLEELSKEISYALRHAPWEYELEMDEQGWVPIEQLINSLRRSKKWEHITKDNINAMMKNSAKKRHEIKNDKIRALYGHSIPMKIKKEVSIPPDILYHGTSRMFMKSIKDKGLIPKGRQYVHLSIDIDTAIAVGKRHDEKPIILMINAKKAYSEGIKFYFGNEKVWLADLVPYIYIEKM